MTDEVISPLRRRMIEDMTIRKSEKPITEKAAWLSDNWASPKGASTTFQHPRISRPQRRPCRVEQMRARPAAFYGSVEGGLRGLFRWTRIIQPHSVNLARQNCVLTSYAEPVTIGAREDQLKCCCQGVLGTRVEMLPHDLDQQNPSAPNAGR
jgi:hypothetical protein